MSLPWHHQDHTWWHSYLHGQQCHRPCSFNKTSNTCIQNIHYIHSSKLRSRKSDVINTIQKLENIWTLNELKPPFKKRRVRLNVHRLYEIPSWNPDLAKGQCECRRPEYLHHLSRRPIRSNEKSSALRVNETSGFMHHLHGKSTI